ncbi:hypothetical protein VP01_1688g3 [Puccinia sorghi]|uniref:Uncharacterized protein n=1 Tax=Puccinia sorghi TaxID=27349 RepID=A0A0L6VFW2_9BASI|nr:hypothetical protein VP01_1688g3 [Puccinia sorghi]
MLQIKLADEGVAAHIKYWVLEGNQEFQCTGGKGRVWCIKYNKSTIRCWEIIKKSIYSLMVPKIRSNSTHFLERQAAMPPYPASIVKRRQEMRRKDTEGRNDDVTKQLAAFNSQKSSTPHEINPTILSSNIRDPSFKCYSCFQQNHSSNRCSILSLDESVCHTTNPMY